MITSTSLNASFIAKLVHASNVAIATESYCECLTSKGRPSVLVEWDKVTQSLVFTHVSGQDLTALVWSTINQFVVMPSYVELVPMIEPIEEEPSSYGFIQAYLLFVMLGILVGLDVLSYGIALLTEGFAIVSYRLAPFLQTVFKTPSRSILESHARVQPLIV